MASEATKVVVRGNMHIVPRVMEVAYFKYEVKFDIWGYWGCLEVGHGLSPFKELFQAENTDFRNTLVVMDIKLTL